jgi:hypothetical protein
LGTVTSCQPAVENPGRESASPVAVTFVDDCNAHPEASGSRSTPASTARGVGAHAAHVAHTATAIDLHTFTIASTALRQLPAFAKATAGPAVARLGRAKAESCRTTNRALRQLKLPHYQLRTPRTLRSAAAM